MKPELLKRIAAFLQDSYRQELQDRAFGDREITWTDTREWGDNTKELAYAYLARGNKGITIYLPEGEVDIPDKDIYSSGVLKMGRAVIARNDMQGDDYPFERYRGA